MLAIISVQMAGTLTLAQTTSTSRQTDEADLVLASAGLNKDDDMETDARALGEWSVSGGEEQGQ